MRMITISLALAGAIMLSGCPKGSSSSSTSWSEEELASNPAANFHKGLSLVQNPDKKTGEIDYVGAYAAFSKSSDLGGGAKASYNAGWTAERLGQSVDAEKHYRKAVEADASYQAAAFSLARVLAEQGKYTEAADIFKTNADANPEDLGARNEYISALIAAGNMELAISESQAVLRKDPKNAEVYRNLSGLYYAQNNYSMSQLTAEKALALDDSDAGVYNNMGVTYLIQSNEAQAIEKFKTALKLNSGHFEANMNLGYTALNSGDYLLAMTCFTAATETNPGSNDAIMGLAVATRGTGDYKVAGQLYDQIIANDPDNVSAYFNAATLNEMYTKDFSKALKYLQAYVDSHNVGPTDDVYALMQRVNDAKAAEDEKKRIEAERKKAEEDRRKRNEEVLKGITTKVASMQGILDVHGPTGCIDPGSVEEVSMVLEQALMIVEIEEVDMAPDIDQMLDAYNAALGGAIENCAPAPAAEEVPAPEAAATEGEGADTAETAAEGEEAPPEDAAPAE